MRTSGTQFETIIDFMERNGDLNKPLEGASGRLSVAQKWKELTDALNLDITGTAKTVDKWKKVWSDLKNNTKRKAAKIHRAATGTGGGPACRLFLTDLEQRVLNIMGSQAATGLLEVFEVGVELANHEMPVAATASTPDLPHDSPSLLCRNVDVQIENDIQECTRPMGSCLSTPFHTEMAEVTVASPTSCHTQVSPVRSRRNIRRPTPIRNHLRGSRQDTAAQQFLNSDKQWRDLLKELVTEHLRLRELELQSQTQWQALFTRGLDILDQFLNKN